MTCGRQIWIRGESRQCARRIGVTRWTDTAGFEHAACPTHLAAMQSLWPVGDPPEPEWLHEDTSFTDDIDAYKRWVEWTQGELVEAFGR